MMIARLLLSVLAAVAFASATAAEPEPPGEYSSDLGRIYWAYHQVLTQKEVCDATVPATRGANGKAFAAWEAQHKALIVDLLRRVTAMYRRASTDEKDYARNLGKYEGAIMQERQEYREQLLKLGAEELREQCQRMAEVLRSPEANLAKVYAAELEAIRKRK